MNTPDPTELATGDAQAVNWRAFALSLARALVQTQRRPLFTLWKSIELSALRGMARSDLPMFAKRRAKYERLVKKRDAQKYLDMVEGLDAAAQSRVTYAVSEPARVDYTPDLTPPQTDVKLIAFYLPQFHPFPENDKWWGTGFTEWRNTVKAQPVFSGHYQPHLPTHFGYYDLRVPSVMEEQGKIAQQYGVQGFAYYFYWFSGKTLMEDPLKTMLANPKVDMPFCLSWANENWTRRWDGKNSDVLIAQNYSEADSRALIRHLAPYFKDPRYIRVKDRALFLVYRPTHIPDIADHVGYWRDEARKAGIGELYIVGNQREWAEDHTTIGFDASLEFPPHGLDTTNYAISTDVDDAFTGHIYDYVDMVEMSLARPLVDYPVFRGVTLSWDNSARRKNNPTLFKNFSLEAYRHWLSAQCRTARAQAKDPSEKIVFINAWNEWAEGTHLEPDERFGFAYLDSTRRALLESGQP